MMAYTNRRMTNDGSAAYDLSIGDRPQRTLPREKTRTVPKKKKAAITPFGVAAVLAVAFVLVLQLFAFERLYESKSKVAALQSQLSDLTEQQGKLRSEYEGKIDFAAIEAQAARLGMAKSTGTEAVYINLSGEDRGEVLSSRPATLTALVRLTDDAFTNLAAYLAQPES